MVKQSQTEITSPGHGNLDGKVALVTGAAGDIGRTTAAKLASQGADVVLADLAQAADGLSKTVQECEKVSLSGVVATSTFDVTEAEAVNAAVDDITSTFGPVDLLFNNAGYQGAFTSIADYSIDDMRRVLDVNVAGVFIVLQAVARVLRSAGRPGAIVNTASMAGVGGAPNMSAYSASKFAVIGITKSAAKDLAAFSIRVNSVSPGFIGPGMMWERQVELQAAANSSHYSSNPTDVADEMIAQIPLGRYGSLDEVADAVSFLLSDQASYLTGVNLEISGGAS